mgnify:CR=1 FL=1
MRTMLCRSSSTFGQYPVNTEPPKTTVVEAFQFSTIARCERRIQQIKQDFQSSHSADFNSPASPTKPKRLRTRSAESVRLNDSASFTNVMHMQIKLGVRTVVTLTMREGDNVETVVDRFLKLHHIPDAAREVLIRRTEVMIRKQQVRVHSTPIFWKR